jgi:hypothetical protein
MPDQYDILRALLSDRPIAFHPMLARLFGGINEALLFQQLAYWSDKGNDPEWIYKTQKDLEEETTLTRTQQETARAKLRKLGAIEEQKRGLPAKLYFRVQWEIVFELLNGQVRGKPASKDAGNLQPRMREGLRLVRGKAADQLAGNPPAITEMTTESTTRDDLSNDSKETILLPREETERIAWYIQDLAREFVDQAPLKSSASRACRLYAQSGKSLEEFLEVLQQARLRTKRYTGNIKAERLSDGTKPKMAYLFSVLEDLLKTG